MGNQHRLNISGSDSGWTKHVLFWDDEGMLNPEMLHN